MLYQIINLPYYTDINAKILVSKSSESNIPKLQEFFINYVPQISFEHFKNNLFFLYFLADNYVNIVGVVAFSNNPINEKYGIENDIEHINYNEISLMVFDEKITVGDNLSNCLMKILHQIVNQQDNNDEAVWMEYQGTLYAKKTYSIFKKFDRYSFQNEADYFAEKLISINKNRSASYIEELMKKTAPK